MILVGLLTISSLGRTMSRSWGSGVVGPVSIRDRFVDGARPLWKADLRNGAGSVPFLCGTRSSTVLVPYVEGTGVMTTAHAMDLGSGVVGPVSMRDRFVDGARPLWKADLRNGGRVGPVSVRDSVVDGIASYANGTDVLGTRDLPA